MPYMIPAARVAAAALHQVEQARNCFPTSYHETEKAMQGKIHLQVASELLALIVPAPVMVNVTDDLVIEPFIPPAEPADAGISG